MIKNIMNSDELQRYYDILSVKIVLVDDVKIWTKNIIKLLIIKNEERKLKREFKKVQKMIWKEAIKIANNKEAIKPLFKSKEKWKWN